ncbi:hypothetical protein H2200_005997 [Cladophialophora chaetospira]|uniref:Uncharacterized protein n=1 Tax=Cladophialophora chaetospira TaxID=386627 RepID=A0AA38XA41_9EURO|nr:hypothetical protein H2200_005997 [Cladophialophora chaetospira]
MVGLRLTNNQTGAGTDAEVALQNHQQPIKEYYAKAFDSSGKFLITSAELVDNFQNVEVVVNAGGKSVVLNTNNTSKQFQGTVDAANGSILARKV